MAIEAVKLIHAGMLLPNFSAPTPLALSPLSLKSKPPLRRARSRSAEPVGRPAKRRLTIAESKTKSKNAKSLCSKPARHTPIILCFSEFDKGCLSASQKAALATALQKIPGSSWTSEWRNDVTHVVMNSLRRTLRLLCGVCRGQHLVTLDWVHANIASGLWADEAAYWPSNGSLEPCAAHGLPGAIVSARKRPMLQGMQVFVAPPFRRTRSDSATWTDDKYCAAVQVVLAAGGFVLPHDVAACDPNTILISPQHLSRPPAIVGQKAHPIHLQVYSPELLFEGALTQQLDWEKHKLITHWPKSRP